jgi:hypothetical protein
MIHTANTVRTLQVVAITVGLAVFLWSTGLPTMFRTAHADSVLNASDTLTNSAPSTVSDHTIEFTTPNGMAISETITLTFDDVGDAFDLTGVLFSDVFININGLASTTAGSAGASDWGVNVNTGTDVITLTAPSGQGGVASSSVVEIIIGLNGGSGSNQITNPAATSSYQIDIGGSMQDSGQVRVAIIDEVTVSASVDTTLTFSVAGVAGGQAVNGTTTDIGSTNVTIPFGTLGINETLTLAHDLSVTTNAANGFTVTVEQADDLKNGVGDTIDGFKDGVWVDDPEAWASPTANISLPDTYGHWGLTSDDAVVPARTNQFGSNEWVSGSTTPIAVMGAAGPGDGTTAGQGLTRVGYQIEISALQEASDYSTQIRYVATPTF